jgi:prepilin-type N-terminal cleavage/methylation domain-containing protein
MSRSIRRFPTFAFTLVEMLVVIGIIAILAALLLPAVMAAITRARDAAIAIEINQLNSAVEAYRLEKGDYPPNFRHPEVVRRHVLKCYPRIDQNYFLAFMKYAFGPNISVPTPPPNGNIQVDEAESLVFWLSKTDKNPQFPFLSVPGINAFLPQNTIVPTADPKVYYDFDQTRLGQTLNSDIPSFKARFCGDTYYIYIDSRSYDNPRTDTWDVCRFAAFDGAPDTYGYADDSATGVRPYWSNAPASNVPQNATLWRDKCKPINPTSFQIISAGQDGDFGTIVGTGGDPDVKIATGTPDKLPYIGTNFTPADKDNITNFSGGKRLGNLIP